MNCADLLLVLPMLLVVIAVVILLAVVFVSAVWIEDGQRRIERERDR